MTAGGPGRALHFVTHPEVVIDPSVPITEWPLSPSGRERMARCCRKALDGAAILSAATGLTVLVRGELGENDRSATGYLPPAEFEATADRFFSEPEVSVRGWAPAVDEQRRIVAAIEAVIAEAPGQGDIAVVSHGAVGALLLAHLLGQPIGRRFDQPRNGGGNLFAVDVATGALRHGWQPID